MPCLCRLTAQATTSRAYPLPAPTIKSCAAPTNLPLRTSRRTPSLPTCHPWPSRPRSSPDYALRARVDPDLFPDHTSRAFAVRAGPSPTSRFMAKPERALPFADYSNPLPLSTDPHRCRLRSPRRFPPRPSCPCHRRLCSSRLVRASPNHAIADLPPPTIACQLHADIPKSGPLRSAHCRQTKPRQLIRDPYPDRSDHAPPTSCLPLV
jgi:hypothetical protein